MKITEHSSGKSKLQTHEDASMFMDWKTQYYEDSNSPLTEVEIQNNPYQNPSRLFFFVETDKMILKFVQKCKGPKIAKMIL